MIFNKHEKTNMVIETTQDHCNRYNNSIKLQQFNRFEKKKMKKRKKTKKKT